MITVSFPSVSLVLADREGRVVEEPHCHILAAPGFVEDRLAFLDAFRLALGRRFFRNNSNSILLNFGSFRLSFLFCLLLRFSHLSSLGYNFSFSILGISISFNNLITDLIYRNEKK